jgi:hypothetical protein
MLGMIFFTAGHRNLLGVHFVNAVEARSTLQGLVAQRFPEAMLFARIRASTLGRFDDEHAF